MQTKDNDSSVLFDINQAAWHSRITKDIALVLYRAMSEVNLHLSMDQRHEPSFDTALFGDQGSLDSLGLANFIVIAERMLEERFGSKIDLTQDDPFSLTNGHFRTVASLVSYVKDQVQH